MQNVLGIIKQWRRSYNVPYGVCLWNVYKSYLLRGYIIIRIVCHQPTILVIGTDDAGQCFGSLVIQVCLGLLFMHARSHLFHGAMLHHLAETRPFFISFNILMLYFRWLRCLSSLTSFGWGQLFWKVICY